MHHTYYQGAAAFFYYIGYEMEEPPTWWDTPFEGMPHLLDYAKVWLDYGNGAEECGNDFGVFTSSLMVAADLWMSGELHFDYKRSDPKAPIVPPTTLLGKDCANCIAVLDPSYFKLVVANPNRRREAMLREAPSSINEG